MSCQFRNLSLNISEGVAKFDEPVQKKTIIEMNIGMVDVLPGISFSSNASQQHTPFSCKAFRDMLFKSVDNNACRISRLIEEFGVVCDAVEDDVKSIQHEICSLNATSNYIKKYVPDVS